MKSLIKRSLGILGYLLDTVWTYFILVINKVAGNRIVIEKGARIAFGSLVFGDVHLKEGAYIGPKSRIVGTVIIGYRTRLNRNNEVLAGPDDNSAIIIGNYCAIAPEVIIYSRNHDYTRIPIQVKLSEDLGLGTPLVSKGPVTIGHDVWLGRRVIVLPGAKIGNGAVIGAGAIVTKEIPSYSVAVGVPAKVIKLRFSREIIEAVEKSKWYEQPPNRVKENVQELLEVIKKESSF